MGKLFCKIVKDNLLFILILFVYTLVITFFCSKMSPFYPLQEWSDVNLYFNIGKAMMNGQIVYKDVFDHKGPIIFLIYGLGYLISNNTFFGVFIIQFLVWFLIAVCAYIIAKSYFSKRLSLILSALFLLLFISHTSQGGSAEEFVACCMMISLVFFVNSFSQTMKNHPPTWMYIHGLMFGFVLLIKFNLIIFWFFPILSIVLMLFIQRDFQNIFQNIIAFLLGVCTVVLPVVIYFVINDALIEAIDTYLFLNTTGTKLEFFELVQRIFISAYQRLRFETVEFSIILIGAFIFPYMQFKNRIAQFSFPLSFLSLFTLIFMAGYVHYYSIPYYIYSILGLITLWILVKRFVIIETISLKLVIVLLFGILVVSIWRKDFFGQYDKDINVEKNVIESFLPYIENETDKSLINLGLDDANALFTYGNIMPNVKYFIAPNLSYERFPELRNEQEQYIKDKRTNFVILAEYTNNALYFSELEELTDNYELIAKFEEYYEWHQVNRFYYLYKRKQ